MDKRLLTRNAIFLMAFLGAALPGRVCAQDHTVPFSTSDVGASKPVPKWGLDAAWPNADNMRRGLIYMGTDQVDLVRVVFAVNAPLVNGDLSDTQKTALQPVKNVAALAGAKPLTMTADTGDGVDAWYKNGSNVIASRWVLAMEASSKFYGKTMAAAEPFNEPDYGWGQGTVSDLYDICGLLQSSSVFSGTVLGGGSTLSCDAASSWYNQIKSRTGEGTTHQLAGSFNGYVNFLQSVAANGQTPVNPEVHSLVEVIAGAEYGLNTGIWWGTAEQARGGFVKACKGQRLGYAEDRPKFTAAAVYRAPSGAVQAFLGASERQGVATTYRFFSKDRDVFYDGYGPRRDYTVNLQTDQDKVVNITWGPDAPLPINGRYTVVNRNSGKVLEVAGASTASGATIQQNNYTGATNQQWNIAPYANAYGDQSFYSINAVHSGKVLDVNNFSYSNGAKVQQWDDLSGDNQKWYFEYAGKGFFYIRNRFSGAYLSVTGSSAAAGASVVQWSRTATLEEQWRLMPAGTAVEFVAPSAPTGLTASANTVSVNLSWNANAESDLAGYTVLRSSVSGGSYEIIARGVTANAFTDKSANQAKTYYYVVQAVDRSVNASTYSNEASAAPTGGPALVASYGFEGGANDASGNANHGAVTGGAVFGAGRIGAGAMVLDGSTSYVNLPPTVANFDQITVAAWVYWNGGAAWQRIFDFGNGTSQYLFLTPSSGSGTLRFAIKNGGAEQSVETTGLSINKWTHVAVTLGNQTARLYVNGVNVASFGSVTIKPSDFLPAINSIGKSQFDADPLFNGKIDAFQVYNYALAGSDISALANAPAAAAPTDPLAYLRFDETAGATASDATGNGWNATLVGSPAWVSGTMGNAVNLSGASGQDLTLPTGIVNGLTDFTISAWVKLTALNAYSRIFDFGTSSTAPTATTGAYMFLTPSNGSAARFAITASGYNNEQGINATAALPTGTWCHVAVTLSGTVGKLYVNGALAGTNNAMTLSPASLGNTTQNYLGRSQFAADPYLNGALDDFRVYGRALSAGEVGALSAGALSAPIGLAAAAGPRQIQLTWTPVANAAGYTLKCATAGGGPYSVVAAGLTSPSYVHDGLNYGTTYYYTVTASNIVGSSPDSAVVSATPQSALITEAERNAVRVTAVVGADGSAAAAMTISASVVGHTYQVQYTNDLAGGAWTDLGDPRPGTGGSLTLALPAMPSSSRGFFRALIIR